MTMSGRTVHKNLNHTLLLSYLPLTIMVALLAISWIVQKGLKWNLVHT